MMKNTKWNTFVMQEGTKEDVNSNTSSIGKDTQLLTTAGSTTITSMLQNSLRNSTNRPLWVDERYKETPKSPRESPFSNTFKAVEELHRLHTLLSSHPSYYIDMQTAINTPTSSPTVSPLYENIPLPPSDTCTKASTRFTSPEYMPCTLSPVNYWMPEHGDVMGEHGEVTEHTTFVVARWFNFGLSWARAIWINRRANPRGPPLPVYTNPIKSLQIMIFNPQTGQIIVHPHTKTSQPAPLPALTQQQLQWLEEDLRVVTA
jgi:hypothetical protein